MISFTVPSIPIAQPRQRHRIVAGKGGKPFTSNYTPTKHPVNAFKAAVQLALREKYQGPPLEGPLRLSATFVMPRPQAMTKKNKPNYRAWCVKKPDLDNLVKAVKDSLSGLAFPDDKFIVQEYTEKLIASGSEPPSVSIIIELLPESPSITGCTTVIFE